jgi:hypothetical protein
VPQGCWILWDSGFDVPSAWILSILGVVVVVAVVGIVVVVVHGCTHVGWCSLQ